MCIIIKGRKVVFTVYVHLKELRESLGMTQEEFGKSIGFAKSTYNNYEKGIREPKSDFWVAVAQKYGVTIDYLMGYSDDPQGTVTGTSKTPSSLARRLAEISDANHLLKAFANQYGDPQEIGELVEGIRSLSKEDKDALFNASITVLTALRAGDATLRTPPSAATGGPQDTSAPQERKDTTPLPDGSEGPQDGE